MHEMKIAGIVVLAALSGWVVRGIRFDRDPEPKPMVVSLPVITPGETLPAPHGVIERVPHDGSLGKRNLFAYRVHERPAVVAAEPVYVAPPAVVAPQPVVAEPVAPPPIPFPYRYIGTFGTAHNRVAAFKRDAEIVTVRSGERIGDFVLRSIGLESAEVEGPDGMRRIPLSSDV